MMAVFPTDRKVFVEDKASSVNFLNLFHTNSLQSLYASWKSNSGYRDLPTSHSLSHPILPQSRGFAWCCDKIPELATSGRKLDFNSQFAVIIHGAGERGHDSKSFLSVVTQCLCSG